MTPKLPDALLAYIDAKIEYEIARLGVDGYGREVNPVVERRAMQAALPALRAQAGREEALRAMDRVRRQGRRLHQ